MREFAEIDAQAGAEIAGKPEAKWSRLVLTDIPGAA